MTTHLQPHARTRQFLKCGGNVIFWACCFGLMGQAWADSAPSQVLRQYAQLRNTWINAVTTAAQSLFGLLALIEFSWSAAVLLLEKSDFQSWTAGVIHKVMWIGAFYTLLLYGPKWVPAIVDSFIQIGQNAAGTGALAPGDVYSRGLQIAGSLLKGSSDAGFLTNTGPAFALVLSAILAFLAFVVITLQFVVALVESYIVVSAGFIFLAFGGSRWTAPYVERYLGLAVSVGVKIMVLYMLIGGGMSLSDGWLNAAVGVPDSPSPGMSALDIVGASLIFMAVCWQAPKLIGSVIGGAPSLTGGDVVSSAATLASATYFATRLLTAGAKAAVTRATPGTSSSAAPSAAANSPSSTANAGNGGTGGGNGGSVLPPPGTRGAGGAHARPSTVAPPKGTPTPSSPAPPTDSSPGKGAS